MLDQFKQTLTKLFASRKERAHSARPRGSLERLEDRMMLSATYGDFGPPLAASSAASVIPQQEFSVVSYSSQSFSVAPEAGRAYRGSQDEPLLPPAFASQRTDIVQPWAEALGWNQSIAGPPPSYQQMLIYHTEPGFSSVSYVETTPWGAFAITHIETHSAGVQKAQQPVDLDDTGYDVLPAFSRSTQRTNSATASSTPNIVYGSNSGTKTGAATVEFDLGHMFENAMNDTAVSAYGPHDPKIGVNSGTAGVRGTGAYPPGSNYLAAIVSTGYDMPIATQVLSRETGTAAALTAAARDVALQEFAQTLFQPNPTASLDRASVDAVGGDSSRLDSNDGLIPSSEESANSVASISADAVTREREAVDAVLDELEDVQALKQATDSQPQNPLSELPGDAAFTVFGADEADAGLVLLQSTGDPNGNGLDLTPVYAEHVERLTAPAKMEASIGIFYQATDVATDDAPLVETTRQTGSALQLRRTITPAGHLPARGEQSSAVRAATLIGATTLTGTLVWLNRGGRVTGQKPTAQKRRVVRS
jgi:hypothetical protein